MMMTAGVSNKVRRSMMPISGGGVQEQPAKILVQVCQALVLYDRDNSDRDGDYANFLSDPYQVRP